MLPTRRDPKVSRLGNITVLGLHWVQVDVVHFKVVHFGVCLLGRVSAPLLEASLKLQFHYALQHCISTISLKIFHFKLDFCLGIRRNAERRFLSSLVWSGRSLNTQSQFYLCSLFSRHSTNFVAVSLMFNLLLKFIGVYCIYYKCC